MVPNSEGRADLVFCIPFLVPEILVPAVAPVAPSVTPCKPKSLN